MKFKVSQSELIEALIAAGKCIGNSVMPILSSYRFNINGDKLQITGGNMEVFMSCDVNIKGGNFQYSVAIPSERLRDWVKELPNCELEFLIQEDFIKKLKVINVTIKSLFGKCTIPAEDGENYPMIRLDKIADVSLPAESLMSGIDKTVFAAHTDPTLVYNSTFLSLSDSELTFAATNRFIFSTLTYVLDEALSINYSVLIPPKVLSVLRTIKCNDNVSVMICERSIQLKPNETTVLSSMLKDGVFPEFLKFIPVNSDKHISIDRDLLSSALKRVSQFSEAVVTMSLSHDVLKLDSNNASGETASEQIDINYQGDDFNILFNGKLLITCLSKVASGIVTISLGTPKTPLIVRETGEDLQGKQNLMMVMPSTL